MKYAFVTLVFILFIAGCLKTGDEITPVEPVQPQTEDEIIPVEPVQQYSQEFLDDPLYCESDEDCLTYKGRCLPETTNKANPKQDYVGPPCRTNTISYNQFLTVCQENKCNTKIYCNTYCDYAKYDWPKTFIDNTENCAFNCQEENTFNQAMCNNACKYFIECGCS